MKANWDRELELVGEVPNHVDEETHEWLKLISLASAETYETIEPLQKLYYSLCRGDKNSAFIVLDKNKNIGYNRSLYDSYFGGSTTEVNAIQASGWTYEDFKALWLFFQPDPTRSGVNEVDQFLNLYLLRPSVS